jgi:Rrf2 family protein
LSHGDTRQGALQYSGIPGKIIADLGRDGALGSVQSTQEEGPGTMRLTGSVAYAVSILLKINSEGDGSPMTAASIARGGRFPPRFLYRILRRLVDAGLLTGVSGPGGGYALARPPRRINLLHIVAAVEGAEEPPKLRAATRKHEGAIRLINRLVERSNAEFRRQLAATSLQKLARSRPPRSDRNQRRR